MTSHNLSKLLKLNYANGVNFSHTSLNAPKGKFIIKKSQIDNLFEYYCDYVIDNYDPPPSLTEVTKEIMPVLVDVDIKKKIKNTGGKVVRLYDNIQVEQIVKVYQTVLKKIVNNCKNSFLTCVLLEKEPYISQSGNEIYLKSGFHLHFINCFLSKSDQEIHLMPRIKHELDQLDHLFEDLYEKNSNLIDCGYLTAPWLMYGSCKSENAGVYKVTTVYDDSTSEISLETAVKDYKIFNNDKSEIDIVGYEDFYLPHILSVIPRYREYQCVTPQLPTLIKKTIPVLREIKKPTVSYATVEENIKSAHELTPLLSCKRSDDYMEWLDIGYILYNISEGCSEGLELWIDFSKKSIDKFDENVCVFKWSTMKMKDKGMGSLKYYASIDSPNEYKALKNAKSKVYLQKAMKGSHNDLAKALYEDYGNEFVCASIQKKLWFHFDGKKWKKCEEGVKLREKISGELTEKFVEVSKEMALKAAEAEDDGETKMFNMRQKSADKIISNLKSAPFKSNVMRECQEVFYDDLFMKKLDVNAKLIGFKNGVYDLGSHVFRQGLPEDYISKSLGVEYLEKVKVQQIDLVEDFLEKIFPDYNLREYFLRTTSEIFIGGNFRKKAYIWSGEGNNGKSVTEKLVELILGEYSVKVPSTLLTGKKVGNGSACPELARAGNGVRQMWTQEPEEGELNIGVIKELTGNDSFFTRGLYEQGEEIVPLFKLNVVCNDPPILSKSDKAAWSRIRILPFESLFTDEDDCIPDTYEEQLEKKIFPCDMEFEKTKLPKMIDSFAWYLLDYLKKNEHKPLIEPEKVKLATNSYRKNNDVVLKFIDECIVSDKKASISTTDIYNMYKDWFKDGHPNQKIPIKDDVVKYLCKFWCDTVRNKWHGYRKRVLQDDIDDGDVIIIDTNVEVDEDVDEDGSEQEY